MLIVLSPRRFTLVGTALCVGILATLVSCRKASPPEQTLTAVKTTVQAVESPGESKLSAEDCGLSAYPVSRSSQQIVADAPHGGELPPNSAMFAKVAIDKDGRVTHLRVLRLAWPEASFSESINEQAVDSIKRWRQAPTLYNGKPVPVCSDVSVIIDLN
jgi:hypothetical protein